MTDDLIQGALSQRSMIKFDGNTLDIDHVNTNRGTEEIVENVYKEILPRLASRDGTALYCDKQTAFLDVGLLLLS